MTHYQDQCVESERVVIHAPFGRDSTLIRTELSAAGFATWICKSVAQLCDSIQEGADGGTICLTGIGSGDRSTGAATGDVAAAAVLKNNVIVGSVNANKRHWYRAGEALARADRSWLNRLITRRERPENFESALQRKADDIKVVVQFAEA